MNITQTLEHWIGEAAPVMDDQVPALQAKQPVLDARPMKEDHVPAAQDKQAVEPGLDYHVPGSQLIQVPYRVAPTKVDHVPTLQDWQAETDDAPIVDDQDPAAHMLHIIGVVDVADCN